MPGQSFSSSSSVRRPTWTADGDATVACAATPSSVGRSKDASTCGAAVAIAATPSSVGRSKEASTCGATVARATPSSVGRLKEASNCGVTWARATPAPALAIRPSEANIPTTNPLHSCHFMTFLSSGSQPRRPIRVTGLRCRYAVNDAETERCYDCNKRQLAERAGLGEILEGNDGSMEDLHDAVKRIALHSIIQSLRYGVTAGWHLSDDWRGFRFYRGLSHWRAACLARGRDGRHGPRGEN